MRNLRKYSTDCEKNQAKTPEDVVADNQRLTPGGYRSKDLIHGLRSADVVTQQSGVSRAEPARSALDVGVAPRPPNSVLTPGGYRDPSFVHRLDHGIGVTRLEDSLRLININTSELATLSAGTGVKPALGSGWITNSKYINSSGQPFHFFSTEWVVPPAPATQSGQTIFLFNALLDASSNDILQPVLQYGPSQAGGGASWTVACWFIDSSGNAFYHDPVAVNVGDILIGVIALTGQSGGLFNYNCFFQGISGTLLVINNISELVVATQTLECYNIQQCSDYPNSNLTAMRGINIKIVTAGTPASTTSRLDGYWGTDSSQHVNFVDAIGHVHELYIHPSVGWVNNDLTAFSSGVSAAPRGVLHAYWGSDSSQHVNFVDVNGHIHELYIHPGAGWVDNDLTEFAHGTPAASNSTLDGYWGTDNSQHVNFVDVNGHVHELYILPGAGWVDNDLTDLAHGTSAVSGSCLDGYWGTDNSQHVNFVDVNGHVHELYIQPGAGWVDNDLTSLARGASASSGSSLDGYWGTDSSQHVNFIDLNGHIHELYIHPGAGWVDNDLTELAHGTPAASNSSLDGYWGTDNSQHVNFVDSAGHVHELYILPGAGWVDNDLTDLAHGTPAVWGSSIDGYWGTDNSQHVNFVDVNGHVHELYILPGAGWVDNDLTTLGGADISLSWIAQDNVTDCGQHTVVVSNANPGGEVDLWY